MRKLLLLFLLQLQFSIFSFGQNPTDTISATKVFGGYIYMEGDSILTFSQVSERLSTNEEALTQIKRAESSNILSTVLGISGGAIIGYNLAQGLKGDNPNMKLLGLGAGLIIIAIPISKSANKDAIEAIDKYNQGLKAPKSNPKTESTVTISDNGIGLLINF